MYLSHLFTNFPQWFRKSNCLPDADFVKQYESDLRQEQVDDQSFSGMWTRYINATANAGQPQNNAKPTITRPEAAQIDSLLTMPQPQANGAAPATTAKVQNVDPVEEARKKQELHASIKRSIRGAVKQLISAWMTNNVSLVDAEKEYQNKNLTHMEKSRTKIAYDVYKQILSDQSTMTTDQRFELYFEKQYAIFYAEMMKPEYKEWLRLHEQDPAHNV
jgi:FtsZ-interacting cell division protein ZipA